MSTRRSFDAVETKRANLRALKQIELEIDLRLLELWEGMSDPPERDEIAAALRFAYGAGYHDALAEDARGERGKLGAEYGVVLKIPS